MSNVVFFNKINLSHASDVIVCGEKFQVFQVHTEKMLRKRKLGTPWEIDGVYCDPAELTGFIHYPHYKHPPAPTIMLLPINLVDERQTRDRCYS